MKGFNLNCKLVPKFVTLFLFIGQTADNFDSFLDDLKLNFDAMTDNNPFLEVAIGDFNARSSSWCINSKSRNW